MINLETREERQAAADKLSGLVFGLFMTVGLISIVGLAIWALLNFFGTFGAAIIGGIFGAAVTDLLIKVWINRGK